jgi:putative membrane protein
LIRVSGSIIWDRRKVLRSGLVKFQYLNPMNFVLRILITALVAFGLAHFLTGIHVDTYWTALIFALILAVLNVLVKPILILLTLPLTLITLGLFLFVVNALVVLLASRFVRGFGIDNFWWGLLFALLLSLITSVIFKELDKEKKKGIF